MYTISDARWLLLFFLGNKITYQHHLTPDIDQQYLESLADGYSYSLCVIPANSSKIVCAQDFSEPYKTVKQLNLQYVSYCAQVFLGMLSWVFALNILSKHKSSSWNSKVEIGGDLRIVFWLSKKITISLLHAKIFVLTYPILILEGLVWLAQFLICMDGLYCNPVVGFTLINYGISFFGSVLSIFIFFRKASTTHKFSAFFLMFSAYILSARLFLALIGIVISLAINPYIVDAYMAMIVTLIYLWKIYHDHIVVPFQTVLDIIIEYYWESNILDLPKKYPFTWGEFHNTCYYALNISYIKHSFYAFLKIVLLISIIIFVDVIVVVTRSTSTRTVVDSALGGFFTFVVTFGSVYLITNEDRIHVTYKKKVIEAFQPFFEKKQKKDTTTEMENVNNMSENSSASVSALNMSSTTSFHELKHLTQDNSEKSALLSDKNDYVDDF